MKQEKSCGAIVWRKNSNKIEFLLLKHKNGEHWAFPKGHVEKNETELETAKREILEETSLSPVIDENFRESVSYSPKKNVIKEVVYFSALCESGEFSAQEIEIKKIIWADYDKALKKITFENDIKIFKKHFEFLKSKYDIN